MKLHYTAFLIVLVSITNLFGQSKKPCNQITAESLFEYVNADKPSKLLFKKEYDFFPLPQPYNTSRPQFLNINQYTIFNKPMINNYDEFQKNIIEVMVCITKETVIKKKTFYSRKPKYATGDTFDEIDEDDKNFTTEELTREFNSSIKDVQVQIKTETLFVVSKNTVVLEISENEYLSKIKTLKQQGYIYDESQSNDDSFAYKNSKYLIHLIKTTGTPQIVKYHIATTLL